MTEESTIEITAPSDVVSARAAARSLAEALGFSRSERTMIATTISELGRLILGHAGSGEISLRGMDEPHRRGVLVVAQDPGRTIPESELGRRELAGSAESFGLRGARRLMDEFEVADDPGRGTTVTAAKWHEHTGPDDEAAAADRAWR